jgi:hypothetical protein
VPVIRIGKLQGVDQLLVPLDQAVPHCGVHALAKAVSLFGGYVREILPEVAQHFIEDGVRPLGLH